MKNALRYLWITGWYAFAFTAVFTAVSLSAARVLLPMAKQYNEQIEERISILIDQPIRIDGLDAEWHGLGPKLVIKNVELINKQNGNIIARFDKAFLGFDLLSLFINGQLGLKNIVISGIDLYVERLDDGNISVGGMKSGTNNDAVNNALLENWILGQTRLKIEHTNITWHDRKLKYKPVKLKDVELQLINDNDNHRLKGKVKLPDHLGTKMTFALDINGNPFHSEAGRNGKIYIKGENIRPGEFVFTKNIVNLESDVEIWSAWEKGKLTRLTSNITARNASIKRRASDRHNKAFNLDKLSARARWQRSGPGWELDVTDFNLTRNGKTWPTTSLHLSCDNIDPAENQVFEMQAGFIQIEDIVALATQLADIDAESRDALKNQNPSGELFNTYIKYTTSSSDAIGPVIKTEFNNITVFPDKSAPGVQGLKGKLSASGNAGTIQLDTRQATAYLPEIFREPVPLDTFNGTITWHELNNNILITSDYLTLLNKDLAATAKFKIEIPDNGEPPFVDIAAQFRNGNGKMASRYMPYTIIPEKTMSWLDNALVDGKILSGAALLHGRINDFPFKDNTGKFQVTAYTEDAVINYAQGWPLLKKTRAKLDFINSEMNIVIHEGKIFNSNITDTRVVIQDMEADIPVVNIKGTVSGASEEKLQYLRVADGLKDTFEKSLEDISMQGTSKLDLELDIPLGNSGKKTAINGDIVLLNNSLTIQGKLGTIWNNLDGKVKIINGNLESDDLHGLLFGYPAKLKIHTKKTPSKKHPDSRTTRFESYGSFKPENVIKRFVPSWKDKFPGTSKWQVIFDVPHKTNSGENSNAPKLYVTSDLKNIAIKAPSPFNKKADETTSFSLATEFYSNNRIYHFNYDKSIKSTLHFNPDDKIFKPRRGTLSINYPQTLKLPDNGIKVVARNMELFPYDAWKKLIANTPEFNQPGADSGGALSWFNSVDAETEILTAFEQTFHSVVIKALNMGKTWNADMDSTELSGKIQLPVDIYSAPVVLKLEKLLTYPPEQSNNNKPDPRDWPSFELESKRFVFDDTEYGSISSTISRTHNGLTLDKLELNTQLNNISGSGNWRFDGNNHTSHFKMTSASKNIGKTMASMGFADSIKNGNGTFSMDLTWPDTPGQVTLKNITGKAALDFKNGHLLDINPGAGRVFGLLSLQTLPRRLFLDFRDVFSEGFSFDEIKGNFNIGGGDAYTSDLQLTGPAARIDISGRTGLVDKDYDQLVTVVPDAAASVPMLTVLAGAEPITALVTWTLKNIFQTQIDEAVSFQYTITGNWDNPKVVKIGETEPAAQAQEEEEEP